METTGVEIPMVGLNPRKASPFLKIANQFQAIGVYWMAGFCFAGSTRGF
jgi:hypothetical protein